MLQDIRDNTQGVVAKVIIGLIVAVFALWGVESIIGGFIRTPPVAAVNGEEITDIQLQTNAQNLMNSIGAQVGELDQELVEQIALDQLIEELVLRQQADAHAMAISSDRIDRAIVDTPQFQIDGRFDPDLAVRTMASQGFNAPLYRQSLQQRMLLGQVANAYTSSNFVTGHELKKIIELSAQTRDVRYLSVTMGTRTLGTEISDGEIRQYYDTHQAEFTEEESVALRYVVLDQDLIAGEISVGESELRAQYEMERDAFEGSAEKRASHILFEVGGDLSEAAALELAAATRQRLLDGEDFGALARELSSDTLSAQEGGDIGYTDGTAFPPEIENVLGGLAVNGISEPVITEFGVHLVKLTETNESAFPPFEDVSARIERDLKRAEVELIYGERLEELSNLAFESGDLTTISQQLNLPIAQSEPITRQGGAGDLANSQVIAAAFSDEVLLEGNNSDVIELTPTRAMVLRVAEFNEAALSPLEQVEPEIAVILRTEMEQEAVRQLGNRLLTALEGGEDIQQTLEEEELAWIEAPGIDRNAAGVNREIVNAAFAMPHPDDRPLYNSLQLANGTFVLLELSEVSPGSEESLDEAERDQIVESMLTDYGSGDFQSYLNSLRTNADIRTSLNRGEF